MSGQDNSQPPTRLWLAMFLVTTLALACIASYFLWAFSNAMESIVARTSERPIPYLTTMCLNSRIGVLLLPLPWIAFAVYSFFRGRPAVHHLVMFSSTLVLALGTVAIVMAIALSLPWFPPDIRTIGIKQPVATPPRN